MVSIPEQRLSRSLRLVLADLSNGTSIPDSEQFREALTCLAYFIPIILGELYREWNFQQLDDVLPVEAQKTGKKEAEIFGLCCMISDQTLTPFYLRLQIAASSDEVSWLECRIGERGQNGMVRKPYCFLREMTKRLRGLDGRVDMIDWVYKATFGHRRLSAVAAKGP